MWIRQGGYHPARTRRGGGQQGFGSLKGWAISAGGWVWMRVAVMLGHGVGEGQVNEQGKEQDKDQGEGQGVVGVRRTDIAVCRRICVCKCITEVGENKEELVTYVVCCLDISSGANLCLVA